MGFDTSVRFCKSLETDPNCPVSLLQVENARAAHDAYELSGLNPNTHGSKYRVDAFFDGTRWASRQTGVQAAFPGDGQYTETKTHPLRAKDNMGETAVLSIKAETIKGEVEGDSDQLFICQSCGIPDGKQKT